MPSQSKGFDEISSKELLEETGISRATLNNYIRMGMLPKPLVRVPGSGMAKTKRIGYFPGWVVERVQTIQRMKQEGMSMNLIVRTMAEDEGDNGRTESRLTRLEGLEKSVILERPGFSAGDGEERRESKAPAEEAEISGKESPGGAEAKLNLDLNSIHAPAYLLNYRYEIEWINESAEKNLLHRDIRSIRTAADRNIFRLFFGWEFQKSMKNWEEMVKLHLALVKERHGPEYLAGMYEGISQGETGFLERCFSEVTVSPAGVMRQMSIKFIRPDGREELYSVYVSFFREGIFFIFEPQEAILEGISDLLKDRLAVIQDLMSLKLPTMIPFCVLVADLQDSCRICTELPPEEYFEVVNDMWKTLEETYRKYYGIYGKHVGDGMVYYFLKKGDTNYLVNALSCALEIKELMAEFSQKWKVRKKWFNDLYLNIGLNEGEEYFSTVRGSTGIEFTALGDTINCAARLSGLARFGSIFATKNLINKMTEKDRKRFRTGIRKTSHEGQVFIENIYSRVIDLLDADHREQGKLMDIGALPVTEVAGRIDYER